ncbi:hypothetical protein [Nocardia sp. NPDC057353]|uniref:hypothetical protein n=1 Tax=Nocardia sp. NPDC057353 TaxID=3346104 RepID=UPI00363F3244
MHSHPPSDQDEFGDPRPPLPRRTPSPHRAPAPTATPDVVLRAADAVAGWARAAETRPVGADARWSPEFADPEPRSRPA